MPARDIISAADSSEGISASEAVPAEDLVQLAFHRPGEHPQAAEQCHGRKVQVRTLPRPLVENQVDRVRGPVGRLFAHDADSSS
ncbi:hypothetical protein [Spongiactinospora sp. 9N601]|uniref:hypothetical protein n=1 Tax=Spongiactinospora sp. 9N601 TaxID=3375149 RepID=UPI0037B90F23